MNSNAGGEMSFRKGDSFASLSTPRKNKAGEKPVNNAQCALCHRFLGGM